MRRAISTFTIARKLNDVKLKRVFTGTSTVNISALFCLQRIVSIEEGLLVKKLTGQVDGTKYGFGSSALPHQIFQVHAMLSAKVALDSTANMRTNMFADGLFHAVMLLVVILGVVLLFKAGRREDVV